MQYNQDTYSLHIETSTTLCSVALGKNADCIGSIDADDGEYHSEKLHLFVNELMKRNHLKFQDLSFIAVSNGPGSYTGLRIAAAAAKTFSYALNIPLITISTLHTQAYALIDKSAKNFQYIISTMQARGSKIYIAIYDAQLKEIVSPQAFILAEENIQKLNANYPKSIWIGSGIKNIAEFAHFADIKPFSKYMIKESYQRYISKQFADLVYFEPMYI